MNTVLEWICRHGHETLSIPQAVIVIGYGIWFVLAVFCLGLMAWAYIDLKYDGIGNLTRKMRKARK